jgi:hypothetical protein
MENEQMYSSDSFPLTNMHPECEEDFQDLEMQESFTIFDEPQEEVTTLHYRGSSTTTDNSEKEDSDYKPTYDLLLTHELHPESRTSKIVRTVTDNLRVLMLIGFLLTVCALLFRYGRSPPPPPSITITRVYPNITRFHTYSSWDDYVSESLACYPLSQISSKVDIHSICDRNGGPYCYNLESLLITLQNSTSRKHPLVCTTTVSLNWTQRGDFPVPCACAIWGRGKLVEPRVVRKSTEKCRVTDVLPTFKDKSQTMRVPCQTEVLDALDVEITIDSATDNLLRRAVEFAQKKTIL